MYFKIKNYNLEGYIKLLYNLKLKGKDSRMRTRFIRLLQERFQMIMVEAQEIQTEYAVKDDNGEVIFKEVKMPGGEKNKSFKITDPIKYNLEINELMDEDYIIEVNEERKEMLMSVKDSILNCEMEFSGQEAELYDSLCEAVEEINYA